jgi:hypothetical protein
VVDKKDVEKHSRMEALGKRFDSFHSSLSSPTAKSAHFPVATKRCVEISWNVSLLSIERRHIPVQQRDSAVATGDKPVPEERNIVHVEE